MKTLQLTPYTCQRTQIVCGTCKLVVTDKSEYGDRMYKVAEKDRDSAMQSSLRIT